MSDHAADRRFVAGFLAALGEAAPEAVPAVLAAHCHDNCIWRIFHPWGEIHGLDAAAAQFWQPLRTAFPDYEHRISFAIAGAYEERAWVATLGHVMGTLGAPWLGIPANHALSFLRFGLNAEIIKGRIARAYVLLDVVDLMRQAGYYPFRRMPGSGEAWPGAPFLSTGPHDPVLGAETLRIVREMQMGLAQGKDLADLAKARGNHSPHWHADMNWYGPAGIGSSRGQRGFLDYHGALFIQAFPDRRGIVRDADGPENRPGHYIRAGDGRFAVTAGWPSLYGTHSGGQWLGLAPSGKPVEMRVADWYRTDDDDRIIDNWVMIDIPHILDQIGLDIFDDLRFIAAPSTPRWPL